MTVATLSQIGSENGARPTVLDDIRQACAATGADFRYMLANASLESGLDGAAKASTSSAVGLYQFIEQTWLALFREHGAKYGQGDLAARVVERADGSSAVADPALRRQILGLRADPGLAAALSAEHTRDNEAWLADRLGRAPTDAELYTAHFLGMGGAGRLLAGLAERPGVAAAELLPRAAAANRSIFYAKDGRPCTVAAVFGAIERRFDSAAARVEGLVDPVEYSAAATVSEATAFVPPASASAWSYDLMLPLPILMALHEVPEDDRQAGGRRA